MFMELFSHMFGDSSILFVSLRVGDITEWYQSSRLQPGLEQATKGQLAEASCLLPSSDQKIVVGKFRKFSRY